MFLLGNREVKCLISHSAARLIAGRPSLTSRFQLDGNGQGGGIKALVGNSSALLTRNNLKNKVAEQRLKRNPLEDLLPWLNEAFCTADSKPPLQRRKKEAFTFSTHHYNEVGCLYTLSVHLATTSDVRALRTGSYARVCQIIR